MKGEGKRQKWDERAKRVKVKRKRRKRTKEVIEDQRNERTIGGSKGMKEQWEDQKEWKKQ